MEDMKEKTHRIYLDYAASTPVDDRIKDAMEPFWKEKFGNAGAVHTEGREAEEALDRARKSVADVFGASPQEVIFTSGGTESNALAIFGTIKHYESAHKGDLSGLHIITTTIEHPSVLDGFRELEERGAKVDYIAVDSRGIVDVDALISAVRPETLLVSVMYVNNEIGTIQPIAEIGKRLRALKKDSALSSATSHAQQPYFHTDASQAPLFLPVRVDALGVDLLTVDAQKIYGPKASGALYIRNGVSVQALFRGGKQERGLRPGTPALPMVVGMSESLRYAADEREEAAVQLTSLRDHFIRRIENEIPGAILNGDRERRLPNNANFSFPAFQSEYLIVALDMAGIAVSARSACIETGGTGSYVVAAIGRGKTETASALRFSFGKPTTKEDVDRTVDTLKKIILEGNVRLPSTESVTAST